MCGIAGFWESSPSGGVLERQALSMANRLSHRGPDDAGAWADGNNGIALAHRRLSILDLSPAGHQPMPSVSGRYIIIFNGEIYNHLELRTQLTMQGLAPDWKGHSDTETLLAAFEAWGIKLTLQRSIGMFALALWDRKLHKLTLARDRMGEKPLYYGWQNNTLLFASELKAIKAHPAFIGSIDRNALTLLMHHNYIPSPYSIYQNIHKLLPGTFVEWENHDANQPGKVSSYWSLTDVIAKGQNTPFSGSAQDATTMLDTLLRDAIHQQMISDVPLGAFLSGGIDSSTIVSLMQAQSTRAIKTFSIGFDDAIYNEAQYAMEIANHLGTEHTELYVSSQMAQSIIPRLPTLFDEPFADSSAIPTFLVAELARNQVTVALSGDGGDEIFGGYPRYLFTQSVWEKFMWLPSPLRHSLGNILNATNPAVLNQCLKPFKHLIPSNLQHINIGQKIKKGASIMQANDSAELYLLLTSHWPAHPSIVLDAKQPETIFTSSQKPMPHGDAALQMMAMESLSLLPDDILCKVDRTTMGTSLESRAPLLDHRVVEFAWQLPANMKIHAGQGKWLLRQVLKKYIPEKLFDRPKMGFATPIGPWLRGPLRDWAEALLDESRLRQEGFLNPVPIRQKWSEHLSGQGNWQYHLWDVLMFQAWLDEQ